MRWNIIVDDGCCPYKRYAGANSFECINRDGPLFCTYEACPATVTKLIETMSDMSEKKEEKDGKPRIVCA